MGVHVNTDGDVAARIRLANGVTMPMLGFGVWGLWTGMAYKAVCWALEIGYRHIDTAQLYGNEVEVGYALADSGIPRNELFLVTKLSQVDSCVVKDCFENSLARLRVDYVDVYVIHRPPKTVARLREIWEELEKFYAEGRIRALGVSNFDIELLNKLLAFATVMPVYIQNKFTIYQPGGKNEAMQSKSMMEFLVNHRIVMVGFSVINPGRSDGPYLQPLGDPHVVAIANRLRVTPSQVLHRWVLQLGGAVIPKSANRARIVENSQLFHFMLSGEDMRLLNGLASLAASSPTHLAPAWCEDVYGVKKIYGEPSHGTADQ